MNPFLFLTIAAVCSVNAAYSQERVLAADKTTAAAGKESTPGGTITVTDNTSGKETYILDMKRSTAPAANANNVVLKTDSTLPQKLYRNEKIITKPVKDEK